jgi:hypothetical protein
MCITKASSANEFNCTASGNFCRKNLDSSCKPTLVKSRRDLPFALKPKYNTMYIESFRESSDHSTFLLPRFHSRAPVNLFSDNQSSCASSVYSEITEDLPMTPNVPGTPVIAGQLTYDGTVPSTPRPSGQVYEDVILPTELLLPFLP